MRAKSWIWALGLIGAITLTTVWTAHTLAQDDFDDDEGGGLEGDILGPQGGYPAGDAKQLGPPSGGYPAGDGPELPPASTGGYPAGDGPANPSASTGGYPAGQGPLPGAVDNRAPLGEESDDE